MIILKLFPWSKIELQIFYTVKKHYVKLYFQNLLPCVFKEKIGYIHKNKSSLFTKKEAFADYILFFPVHVKWFKICLFEMIQSDNKKIQKLDGKSDSM